MKCRRILGGVVLALSVGTCIAEGLGHKQGSCAAWPDEKNIQVVRMYMSGYVDGMLTMWVSVNKARGIEKPPVAPSMAALALMLDSYCQTHPETDSVSALGELVIQLQAK